MKDIIILFVILIPGIAFAEGNTTIGSFSFAKKILEEQVYFDHRVTFYCLFDYDRQKRIDLPIEFNTQKHRKRAKRIEWEHIVPAENFGRAFREWREGGRKKARSNEHFRRMEADLYNLVPAVGAVNATRENFNFEELWTYANQPFGPICPMKVEGRKVEPPSHTKGFIARTYKYMDAAYSDYKMSKKQKRLMDVWDRQYPVDRWECTRAKRIEYIQGNENPFVKKMCIQEGLW